MKIKVPVKRKYMLVKPPAPPKEKKIPFVSRRVRRYLVILVGALSILALIIGLSCFFIFNYGYGQSRRCEPDEFTCDSGDCIQKQFFCDRRNDCPDNSDETNCTDCTHNDLLEKCPSSNQCIFIKSFCNGKRDCVDGSDEDICTEDDIKCGRRNSFQCETRGECIEKRDVCNGLKNCGDNSDEKNCEECARRSLLFCPSDRKCIHSIDICDGIQHCTDGSDELNCSEQQLACGKQSKFTCDSGQCIYPSSICNGFFDCGDNSDERNCTECERGSRLCDSGNQCVHASYLCNGDKDCDDGSDENNCIDGYHCCDHEAIKSQVKDKLQMAVRNCNSDSSGNSLVNTDPSSEDDFSKTMDGSFSAPNNKEDFEVLNYLQDTSKALDSLDRYPAIKKIFKRYNTTLPSSAPVERLFSFAGMVHIPKRNRLSDDNFEQLVLLKANDYRD